MRGEKLCARRKGNSQGSTQEERKTEEKARGEKEVELKEGVKRKRWRRKLENHRF